ncbi:hypothetical protein A3F62_00370 [Candidatus Woesebacteria bacterium RIFCSPHIGHO2_12_FULL_44_11]|uniref:Uncharacterized protein n=1 Tax=Candidatus Woesebacteria bacterium RIFCSPLOWO2_01_FULL_44_14 TaxID=1802525 RepID=A0A1F8C0X3_9BACT|nr:MAG: hypothetical protein A3F62_00370 [Candidatus Woesebacteria bacterium RIFCSPHIGHO2_12_FULL_44_11]OGM69976.1 MAG: hypothetical protein A2975_05210 [Candidatus Woesebacteria bacterium RIFCSPLOWO2_01_FULL_44_14]
MEKVKLVKKWIAGNKLEFGILLLILVVGAFFRLYRIGEYMTFLGDEGRDAILVRRLLVHGDPILIGPGTSIGNMYLGPLYYYLMAPALLLAAFNPVGPAVEIALLGVATIWLVWYVARVWYGKIAAGVASALYAIAPTVIIYARSSWNPNIMPFFSLLLVFSVWKFWRLRTSRWVIVTAVTFAATLQSHYLALILGPIIVLFWFLTFISLSVKTTEISDRAPLTKFLKNSFIGLFLFIILMSPLVIFDARHGWNNFNAIKVFFSQRQTTVSARPWTALPKLPDLFLQITARLLTGYNEFVAKALLVLISVPSLLFLLLMKRVPKNETSGNFILFVWIGLALVGLGIYKQHIYDHYFGFFFAAPFLIVGALVGEVFGHLNRVGKTLSILAFLALAGVNLVANPLRFPPNRQLARSVAVAERIEELAAGEKFNFAVIAERNYEGAYQYFLEKNNAPFIIVDPLRLDQTVAEALFVVCELPPEKCDPTHNPKTEVAAFGWSKIEEQWEEFGVTIYKLAHSQ